MHYYKFIMSVSTATTIDLVNHIKSNPITKYRVNYSDKLIEKIQSQFTTDEQQLFVYNFYSYLNYSSNEFIINFDKAWEFIGFTRKDNAKRLLKPLRENVDYCITYPNKNTAGNHGANKERIELTITAFKKICLSANTDKSSQIIDYYIKLEDIMNQCLAESTGLNPNADALLALETAESAKLKSQLFVANATLKSTKETERHNVLMETFKYTSPIVYIIRVKSYDDGRYIVKIGESRKGLKDRYDEHKLKYEEAVILDCYEVLESKTFESYLHNHPDIRPFIVRNLQGHEKENELFMVGTGLTYATILKIINADIHKYNKRNSEFYLENELLKSKLEVQILQTPQSVSQTDIYEMKKEIFDLSAQLKHQSESIALLNSQINLLLQNQSARPVPLTTASGAVNKTLGPRLQQIDPTTLQLVKVYDTFADCIKTFNTGLHSYAMQQHMQKNTAYFGYRWRYVERDLDPNVIHGDILPTQESKEKCLDYIAKLNADKTQILTVYVNRKTAALQNGYSASGLDDAVAKSTLAKGNYYIAWEKCPQNLANAFEAQYGPVVLYESGVGRYKDDQLVAEYKSKHECYTSLNMSDKTMRKVLESGAEYEGYCYKVLTNKMFMGA